MGILGRIFGSAPRAGAHPDSAVRTADISDGHRYIVNQYLCPDCRKPGSKEVRGHAQVVRRMPDGRGRVYKVYNVLCGCGVFSTLWTEGTGWMPEHVEIAEEMCQPDGKCMCLVSSNQMPAMDPSLF